jgi:hypothetical protein
MTGLKIVIEPVLHISMVPVALSSSIEGTLHDNPRASVLFRRAWPIYQPISNYGETMSRANIIRQQIWEKLKPVAKPDSRFHLNVAEVIPDFEGSEKVIDRLVAPPTSRRGKCMVSSAVLKRFAPLAWAWRTVVSDRAMYIIS